MCQGFLSNRGKGVCRRPALAAPELFSFLGKPSKLYLCWRCRADFRKQFAPWAARATAVPIRLSMDYLDPFGHLWPAYLVRFYLMGVEGLVVNRRGQLNAAHINCWWALVKEEGPDAWEETVLKYEREDASRDTAEKYAQQDPATVAAVHRRALQMLKDGEL